MNELSYEVRAAAGGALLAQHLLDCVIATAHEKELPDVDWAMFQSPDDVHLAFASVGALLGIKPGDDRAQQRIMNVCQAFAEMIAKQGAQLECELAGVIHDETREIVMMRTVPA